MRDRPRGPRGTGAAWACCPCSPHTRDEALDRIALLNAEDTSGNVSHVAGLAEDVHDLQSHGGSGEAGDDGEGLDQHVWFDRCFVW